MSVLQSMYQMIQSSVFSDSIMCKQEDYQHYTVGDKDITIASYLPLVAEWLSTKLGVPMQLFE